MKNARIQYVIPAAGLGTRFSAAGYKTHKPLIEICRIPMLIWVVVNLGVTSDDDLIIIVQSGHRVEEKLAPWFEALALKPRYVELVETSQGPADSVMAASHLLNKEAPLIVANSDQLVYFDFLRIRELLLEKHNEGIVLTMKARGAKWSFARVALDDRILEIAEKKEISQIATVGIYGWRQAGSFFESFTEMVAADDRTNGEFYVAPSYNYLIKRNMNIASVQIGAVESQVFGLGTPEDLDIFLSTQNLPEIDSKSNSTKDLLNQVANFINKSS